MKKERDARAPRPEDTALNSNQTIRDSPLFTSHQSRITTHTYFFGLDSGGTIPLAR